jgi:hypothetical protein
MKKIERRGGGVGGDPTKCRNSTYPAPGWTWKRSRSQTCTRMLGARCQCYTLVSLSINRKNVNNKLAASKGGKRSDGPGAAADPTPSSHPLIPHPSSRQRRYYIAKQVCVASRRDSLLQTRAMNTCFAITTRILPDASNAGKSHQVLKRIFPD